MSDTPGQTRPFQVSVREIPLRVSVLIPTRNRPAQLTACLKALSVSFPSDSEVIVISDGGDRGVFPDFAELKDILNLRVMHIRHGGPSLARNRGLEVARGSIAAFIDDDCLPEPDWLERVASAVSFDPPTAVGGKTRNGLPSNPYATALQLILDLVELDRQLRDSSPMFFPSNNLAFPTKSLSRLGGFNPEFKTAEDRDLCRRWLRAGYRLAHASDAVLFHSPELDLTGLWHKFFAYGKGAAQFHDGSERQWKKESLGFHLRVPALVARIVSEQRLGHRTTLAALVVLWEVANLMGFLKHGRWNQAGRQKAQTLRGPVDDSKTG